jgi:hypothetical protein
MPIGKDTGQTAMCSVQYATHEKFCAVRAIQEVNSVKRAQMLILILKDLARLLKRMLQK